MTLDGYDATHADGLTLDNVIVDGITSSKVTASYANVTLGPGNVNFTPSGTGVTVTNTIAAGGDAERLHRQVGHVLSGCPLAAAWPRRSARCQSALGLSPG